MRAHSCMCMSLPSLIGMALVMMVPMLLPLLISRLLRIVRFRRVTRDQLPVIPPDAE